MGGNHHSDGVAMNRIPTHREMMLAKRIAWARAIGLNPKAVDLAGKYLNLNQTMLQLISDYEYASEQPAGDIREEHLRDAWRNVILYLRTLPLPVSTRENSAA
jgi:hypothetical protein